MKYFKQMSGEKLLYIGTLPTGTEITEAEYYALLAEIQEKAALVDKVYSGEISITDVPEVWQEEVRERADKRKEAEAAAVNGLGGIFIQ